jgi:hypothetical protein
VTDLVLRDFLIIIDSFVCVCVKLQLAMAGLKFMRMDTPSAQCFACDAVIENLEADSDPW